MSGGYVERQGGTYYQKARFHILNVISRFLDSNRIINADHTGLQLENISRDLYQIHYPEIKM
ncbi:MAG: hypothetical protein UHS49_02010 [Faecalimonas sp.]|nr:hypothetical protein [Faecalimonas sp.]